MNGMTASDTFAAQLPALLQAAWLAALEARRARRWLEQLADQQRAEQRTLQQQLLQLAQLIGADQRPAPTAPGELPAALQRWPQLTAAERIELLLLLLYGTTYDDAGAPARLTQALGRLSGELPFSPAEACSSTRAALVVPQQALSREQREHLAGCMACRSYAAAWQRHAAPLEQALRAVVVPPALHRRQTALVRRALPQSADAAATGRYRWLPLLPVLLLIAVLVLPSLWQPRREQVIVSVPAADSAAPSAPELAAAALAGLYRVPAEGSPLWYARYETIWYFDEQVQAPLVAELWLDRDRPARHRLQLSHRDGGAPYELELGDGERQLYYALDAAYVPALYGVLTPPTEGARLLALEAPPDQQQRYLAARLDSGPWQLPAAYLNLALQAADLRLLGRQSRDGRQYQLLAFSGLSPLEPLADEAAPVTVLLTVDLRDGRLIEVNELIGPSGGTQISRRTWRFMREEWLTGSERERAAFTIERAWTGLAEIPDRPTHVAVAPELPLLSATLLSEPAPQLIDTLHRIWLPQTPPDGSERAYLLWPDQAQRSDAPPLALVYLGAGRRLVLAYTTVPAAAAASANAPRATRLTALRAGRLRSDVSISPPAAAAPPVGLVLEADGFSRAEVRALTAALRPIDAELLRAQDVLFAPQADRRAREALLGTLGTELPTTRQSRWQIELAARASAFPYAWQPAAGLPDTFLQQTDVAADGTLTVQRFDPQQPQNRTLAVEVDTSAWRWSATQQTLIQYQPLPPRELQRLRLPLLQQIALEFLTAAGGTLSAQPTADGGLLISRRLAPPSFERWQRRPELVAANGLYAVGASADDPAAWTLLVELELNRDGTLRSLLFAHAPLPGMRIPLQRYTPADFSPSAAVDSRRRLSDIRLREPLLLLDRQRDGTPPTQPDLSDLALSLRREPVLRYFLRADVAVEQAQPGLDAGRATLGSLAYEALKREIGLATWYRLAADRDAAAVVLLQAPADQLGAFLRSGAVLPRGQALPVGGENRETGWLLQFSGDGEQTLTLLTERDGMLLALIGPRPLLEAQADELLAALAATGDRP